MAGTLTITDLVDDAAPGPPRRGRRAVTLLATVAAMMMLSGVLTSCETTTGDRNEVIAHINYSRAQAGVSPLAENAELNTKADAWASRLRDDCNIYHSRLADGAPQGWQKLGENVGRGGDISGVHQAYMNSPGHRRNILDPSFNLVGTGAVWGTCDGYRTVFTVQVFMRG